MKTKDRWTIAQVNEMDFVLFMEWFGGIFEHSPWVAQASWPRRPFRDRAALHAAMCSSVRAASETQQLSLIRAHPDLVGQAAREGRLGPQSTAEQADAGLDQLDAEEVRWFERYNRAYQEKFGFPFILCVRAVERKRAIMEAFELRLHHEPAQERATAVAEIEKIAAFRLADYVAD